MYADDRARTQTIPSSSTNFAHNTNADHQHKQYLAVAPFPSRNYSPMIGSRVQRPSHASIQIWSLSPSKPMNDAMNVDGAGPSNAAPTPPDDAGEMHCEMVLCVESGPAFELKWCPLPSNDPVVVRTLSSYLQSATHPGYRAQAIPPITPRESLVSSQGRSQTGPFRSSSCLTRLAWRDLPSTLRTNQCTVSRYYACP